MPGTRFRVGLDPLIGLFLPAVGDAVGGFVSLGMLFLAVQYRVPAPVIGRMVLNVGIDSAIGAIPVVGDLFDFGWKSNERNFELMALVRGDLPQRRAPITHWFSVIGLSIAGLICVAAPIARVADPSPSPLLRPVRRSRGTVTATDPPSQVMTSPTVNGPARELRK